MCGDRLPLFLGELTPLRDVLFGWGESRPRHVRIAPTAEQAMGIVRVEPLVHERGVNDSGADVEMRLFFFSSLVALS